MAKIHVSIGKIVKPDPYAVMAERPIIEHIHPEYAKQLAVIGGRKAPRMELTLFPDILEVKDGKVVMAEQTTLAASQKGRKKVKRHAEPFHASLVMPERKVLGMKFRRTPRHPKP